MKKWMKLCACGLAAAMLLSGCGSKKDETTATTSAETTAAATAAADTEAPVADGLSKIVTLGEYKGLQVEKADTTVTDDEVQKQLDDIVKNNPEKTEITDRPIQEGDVVNFDYVGKKEDGTEFDSNNVDDLVIGSGSFIDGFEDGMIGAQIGSTITLNLTFPEDYFETSLAGQPAVFDVTINGITEQKDAVLDDAFVTRISDGEYTTVDVYRQYIQDTMLENKEQVAAEDMFYDMLGTISENSTFELSDADMEAQKYEINSYYQMMASMYGATVEQMTGKTTEEIDAIVTESAEQTLKWNLIVKEISEKENVELVDADYETLAQNNGYESAEQMKSLFSDDNLKEAIQMEKVQQILIDNANIQPKQ